jgi:hypothetical protein
MNQLDAEQRAIDALIEKYRRELRLVPTDSMPAVYDFDPTGWMLFRMDAEPDHTGEDEFVAVHRTTGRVRLF